jgi:hypothetical protein
VPRHFGLILSEADVIAGYDRQRAQKSPDLQLSAAEHPTLPGVVFEKSLS